MGTVASITRRPFEAGAGIGGDTRVPDRRSGAAFEGNAAPLWAEQVGPARVE